jgi:hypothetical protein
MTPNEKLHFEILYLAMLALELNSDKFPIEDTKHSIEQQILKILATLAAIRGSGYHEI